MKSASAACALCSQNALKFVVKWKIILPSVLIFAMASGTNANVTSVAFDEVLVYGTDTLETPSGDVLSMVQYVYWGIEIPPDIANEIATDPTFATSDPAARSFIQSTASEAALTDDMDFLTDWTGPSPLPDVIYTNASPTIYTGFYASPDSLGPAFSAAFPAFSETSQEPAVSIGLFDYSTGAMDPSGNIIDGTAGFATYEIDVVEQSVVPEPSGMGLIIGLATLALGRKGR